MKTDKQQILNLVQEYIEQKLENEEWNPGEDWVSYSGPVFDASEYLAAVDVLLDGWMIFGKTLASLRASSLQSWESFMVL